MTQDHRIPPSVSFQATAAPQASTGDLPSVEAWGAAGHRKRAA
ncbi:hypothetical protein [Actinomadura sp. KC345]|nr:hypothetical protein [Actinomadura sp. KC345]